MIKNQIVTGIKTYILLTKIDKLGETVSVNVLNADKVPEIKQLKKDISNALSSDSRDVLLQMNMTDEDHGANKQIIIRTLQNLMKLLEAVNMSISTKQHSKGNTGILKEKLTV